MMPKCPGANLTHTKICTVCRKLSYLYLSTDVKRTADDQLLTANSKGHYRFSLEY